MSRKVNTNLSDNDAKALKIVKYFTNKGFTLEQACAICGNVWQESKYKETARNSSSGAFGLFQYLPQYSKDLQKNTKKNDFDFQLEYTWGKYNAHKRYGDSNKGSAMYKKWHKTELGEFFKQNKGTIDDYVELWMCAFERCGVSESNLDERKREAKRVAKLFSKLINNEKAMLDLEGHIDNGNESPNLDTEKAINNDGIITYDTETPVDCGNLSSIGGDVAQNNGDTNNEQTSLPVGFSGEVTNPKMKLILSDVSYFINLGDKTSKCPYPKGSKVPLKPGKYMHKCTYGPTTWYKNAGITLRWWCGDYHKPTYNCVKKQMHEYGFYLAMHADFEEARNWPTSLFRPGDVAALLPNIATSHGLMWTGHDWRSDCIETNICSAYRRTTHGRAGNYSVTIWRRRDCQEPGLENDKEADT